RYRFSPLGRDMPLFSKPPPAIAPFSHLNTRLDVPQPIRRAEFASHAADFYGQSFTLYVDGVPVGVAQICCANLADRPGGAWCKVPSGLIAIDPELGRIQFAADLPPPQSLRLTYNYGFPAALGGGPYDRSASRNQIAPAQAGFFAVVGTPGCETLEATVAQWNQLPAGTTGIIILPNFERFTVDLTGPNALQLPAGSSLTLAAAEPVPSGGERDVIWNNACVTLDGNLEVVSQAGPPLPEGELAPAGQLSINGLWIAGQLTLSGAPATLQLTDTTLVPGLDAASPGLSAGEPSIVVTASEATLCLLRCICGPIAAAESGTVRICGSVVDATSPCCVAYAGADGVSQGADLHIEDSTVIGKLHTRTLTLASNTIFVARRGRRDPWPAAIWCSRRQVGCVRFCSLPFDSITPRRFECLPPDAASEAALAPSFITLKYGHPSYALLSGDVPMAVWRGADNGSQMGVYYQIQETEAVGNVQIRTPEYLPVALESGVFLNPSRPLPRRSPPPLAYGVAAVSCCDDDAIEDPALPGIGAGLL
ncbi:MAG TPA: hypothetical protein VGC34_14935, partial [Steroidobacteraceae bacterium]